MTADQPDDLVPGQVLAYRARSGRYHLLRAAGLLDMGAGCTQTAIRFLAYAELRLPDPALLAAIPDRRRHPRWKKTELRIVDDEAACRAAAGVTVVGVLPGPASSEETDPKGAATWQQLARTSRPGTR